MNSSIKFKDNLSTLMFLNVKQEILEGIFNIEMSFDHEVFLPIRNIRIISEVNKELNEEVNIDKLPVHYFIEGMFFVLGADSDFKYCNIYRRMIENLIWSKDYIKGSIYEEIKKNNLEEAYLMLKGLSIIERNNDNFDKLLLLCDELRKRNKIFKSELVNLINDFHYEKNYFTQYFYDALINKEEGKLQNALNSINIFIENTKNNKDFAIALKNELQKDYNYTKGKELSIEQPESSLKLLIPLLDDLPEDATLYYYIAKAYRNLGNYEKAIFYLNDALVFDSALVDVINELGLNYASLGMVEEALKYFRKAFDATKSVEICTNIIACYLQLGEISQAELHLELAKKMDPNDELILVYENLIKGD